MENQLHGSSPPEKRISVMNTPLAGRHSFVSGTSFTATFNNLASHVSPESVNHQNHGHSHEETNNLVK